MQEVVLHKQAEEYCGHELEHGEQYKGPGQHTLAGDQTFHQELQIGELNRLLDQPSGSSDSGNEEDMYEVNISRSRTLERQPRDLHDAHDTNCRIHPIQPASPQENIFSLVPSPVSASLQKFKAKLPKPAS